MPKKSSEQISIDFDVCLLSDYKAMQFLETSEFMVDWSCLYEHCCHASVFQHPSFVLPWYRKNKEDHIPVLLAVYEGKKLCALLTLARKVDEKTGKASNKLIGAGAFYALYQTWLILPGYEAIFWEKGLKKLFREMPGCSINLKSLPTRELYAGMTKVSSFKRLAVLEKHLNPVLDFGEDGYQQVFGKRHFRAKYNRLGRAGKMDFEKISSAEELTTAMETIEVYHNLRQGAAFNKVPFHQDKKEKQLFRDWFEEGVLHVTALKLDQELIASVIVVNDFGKTGHLAGLITYSPRHAKLSPGLVHLYLLGQKLLDESFMHMKLSPGDDAYKERFCNRHEELFEILISPNWRERFYRRIRVLFRAYMSKKGIRPMAVQVNVSKKLAELKNFLYTIFANNKDFSSATVVKKLELIKNGGNNGDLMINSDLLSDLLRANDRNFSICRWKFLEDALKRLEDQENFITVIKEEELVLCVWYSRGLENSENYKNSFEEKDITKIYASNQIKI